MTEGQERERLVRPDRPNRSNNGRVIRLVANHFRIDLPGEIVVFIAEWLITRLREMEKQMWDLARDVNDDAIACSTGQGSCQDHTAYDMTLVDIDDSSSQLVSEVASEAVLPVWGEQCNAQYPECTQVWNETVGDVTGFQIQRP